VISLRYGTQFKQAIDNPGWRQSKREERKHNGRSIKTEIGSKTKRQGVGNTNGGNANRGKQVHTRL